MHAKVIEVDAAFHNLLSCLQISIFNTPSSSKTEVYDVPLQARQALLTVSTHKHSNDSCCILCGCWSDVFMVVWCFLCRNQQLRVKCYWRKHPFQWPIWIGELTCQKILLAIQGTFLWVLDGNQKLWAWHFFHWGCDTFHLSSSPESFEFYEVCSWAQMD